MILYDSSGPKIKRSTLAYWLEYKQWADKYGRCGKKEANKVREVEGNMAMKVDKEMKWKWERKWESREKKEKINLKIMSILTRTTGRPFQGSVLNGNGA